MYKVGTGEHGTTAGKVYLFSHADKGSNGCWVYCKGKLYLRTTGEKLGVVSVISPETFQNTATLKLSCGDAFKNSMAVNFNRNYPLLTDGDNLYAIVLIFKKIKRKVREDMKEEFEELKKSEEGSKESPENNKRPCRIKQPKKPQALEDAKICEFHLVEFDVNEHQKDSDIPADSAEATLLEELFEGFSGYFTQKECLRALHMHSNSIEAASRWLLEHGESERGQTVIPSKKWVLLGQSLVRSGRDSDVAEGSVLNPNLLSSQWTMNKSQVTLHLSPSTAKIFSTKEQDVKKLEGKYEKPQQGLRPQPVYNDNEEADEEESEGDREAEKFIHQVKQQNEISDKYFEEIELKGSLLCTMTAEALDYERYSVAYSSSEHKFYALSLDNSSVTVLLEYGDYAALNVSTMPDVLKNCSGKREECSAPIKLAADLLRFLKEAEGYRYCLPWKWNNWAIMYQKAYDSLSARFRNSDSEDAEAKKRSSKLAKLKQRAEHFKELQQEKLLAELGIKDFSEASSMQLPKAVIPARTDGHRTASHSHSRPGDLFLPPRGMRGPFDSYRIRKPAFFEDYRSDSVVSKVVGEKVPKLREEKQEMQVVIENLKEPAFCSAGSWKSLKLLLKGIRREGDMMVLRYYDQLLLWSLHCGVFSNYPKVGNPELVKELSRHLLSVIKGEVKHANYSEQILNYAWRILVFNWQIFITTAEVQSFVFQQAIKLPLGEVSGKTYYEVMLSPSSTPFELFYCKHLKYPPFFYPNSPLQQAHVQIFQLAAKILETSATEKKGKAKEKPEFIDITSTNRNKIFEEYKIEEFLPKAGALLITACEGLEDHSLANPNITLEERIKLYADVGIPEEDDKHKKVFLDKMRADQSARVEENWRLMHEILTSSLAKQSDKETLLIWSAYNQLVLRAMPIFNSEDALNVGMLRTVMRHAEMLISKFKETTKEYVQLEQHHVIWLDHLFEHLFYLSNYLYAYKFNQETSVVAIPELLKLLSQVAALAKGTISPALIELCSQDAQSIDHLRSKVFETSHPYGRRESSRKEAFAFPGAIAVSCELDKRCRSENSNDYLSVYTIEEMHSIYDYLGTGYRAYARGNDQNQYILYGDTVNVSFQVNSQLQRLDPVARWGFRVIFRPIYGEPEKVKDGCGEEKESKVPNSSGKKLILTVKALTRCIAELLRGLIKGVEISPEEKECKEFFELSLAKEGLKLAKRPRLFPRKKPKEELKEEEKKDIKESKKEDVKGKKKYKANTKVMEPAMLKALKESEEGKGWLADLVGAIRQSAKYPDLYLIEKRLSSFTKDSQDKWAHAERVCTLALLYHMGYHIEDTGIKINEEGMERLGQALNEILRLMLKRLAGLKECYHLKLMFLEECADCYEKFFGKIREEMKSEVEPVKKEEKVKVKKKPKKGTVVKSLSKRKKIILPAAKAEEPPQAKEAARGDREVTKVSQLEGSRRQELKGKVYDQVYDSFTQRYQGSADLLRSVSEGMNVPYSPKDHADTQRKVFFKLQESLKSIINLENAEGLPDEIPTTLAGEKNSYDVISSRIIKRALFLLEMNNYYKSSESAGVKAETKSAKRRYSEEEMFSEVLLKKSLSLQPFLEGAQTDTQVKKAVDDYLKWKRAKAEETQQISDEAAQSIISVITSSYSPRKLRKSFKLQERRGMQRELGLKHLLDLASNYGVSRLVVGNIIESVPNGPFSAIQGCSPELTLAISSYATEFALKIINTIIVKFDSFDKDKKNLLRTKQVQTDTVCSCLKEILYLLSEFSVLLTTLTKADIIKLLYKQSSKSQLTTFISKVLDIMLIVQEHLVLLGYPSTLSLLSTYIEKACRSILDEFIEYAAVKGVIQNEIVEIMLASLEVKVSEENVDLLLTMLHGTLVSFDIERLDVKAMLKCGLILKRILMESAVPSLIKKAGKCCQLVSKSLPVEDFISSSIQKIGSIALIEDYSRKTEEIPVNRQYYAILHLNSREDDPTFIFTALYHLESARPSFTKHYPRSPQEQSKRGKSFKGPFDSTPLFAQKQAPKLPANPGQRSGNSSVLSNISRQFEEIVKVTQESAVDEDSHEEKVRKLNEENYNRRVSQHLSDAKKIYKTLSARSFVQFPIAVSYKEALELAELFYKAYDKKLEAVPLNPYMKPDARQKKLSTGATVEESFPLLPKQPKNAPDSSYPIPPAIVIAKERLVISLCEKRVFKDYFTHATKIKSRKTLGRVKYVHLSQCDPVVGASYSLCITTIVNLLRTFANNDSENRWSSFIKKRVDKAFAHLANDSWTNLSENVKAETIGALILISGWLDYIRPGASVEAVVNNNKEACTVVAGGLGTGSQTARVVIRADTLLAVHSIPLECIRLTSEHCLHKCVDQAALSAALLTVQKLCDNNGSQSYTPEVLRLLLLKIAIEMKWKATSKELIELMIELARHNSSEIIKRASEDNLAEAWEKLIEKADESESLFFVPRVHETLAESKERAEVGRLEKPASPFEYVQPVSSYQKSLPDTKTNPHAETESALKLLSYWEKHIIPAIQRMVRNAYKPWEKVYYFEQLRNRLRTGNLDQAMEEALIICDQQLPGDCLLPKDNRDWSAFTNEECIAGTWAKATLNVSRNCSNPVLANLAEKMLQDVPVLIKATDWEIQAAFCEYKDPDTRKKIALLIPVDSLKEQEKPLLPPAVVEDYAELNGKFRQTLKDLTANFALRTFVAMYDSCQLATKNLSDVVHWVVMDELREDNVEGWMSCAKPILELPSVRKLKQSNDKLIPKVMKEANSLSTSQEQSSKLAKLESQIQKLPPEDLEGLQRWCIDIWQRLAGLNATMIINLSQAADSAASDQSLAKGVDGNAIFPLHKLVGSETDYGACIITFEVSAFLAPNSKLRFYSDASGQSLVGQMNAGKTQLQFLAPLTVNHGKVWCHFHQGTVANLSKELQENALPSSLPCCVTFIPVLWTTACWLAETLTTAKLQNPSLKDIESFYKPLVRSMCSFVQEDTVPSILKQLGFVLMNRVLHKMRCIYNVSPYMPGSCLEKLGLSKDWFKLLVAKLSKMKENEDSGDDATYSEFIQDAGELIATALLPFNGEDEKSEAESQSIVEGLRLPDWMRAIIDVTVFLYYFRKEGKLTKGLVQDIFDSLSLESQLENVIMIKHLPKAFNARQIREKLVSIFTTQKLRIVNPDTDIIIPADGAEHTGSALIITDGFELGHESLIEEKSNVESPEKKVKEAPTEWMCPQCTFLNPNDKTVCDMCESQRPAEAGREENEDGLRARSLGQDEYNTAMWEKLREAVREMGKLAPEEEKAQSAHTAKETKKEKGEVKKEEAQEAAPEILRSTQLLNQSPNSLLDTVLRDRLLAPSANKLLPPLKDILTKIYERMKKPIDETPLVPKNRPEYDAIGIDKKKVTAEDSETFVKRVQEVIAKNPLVIWELLAHYGYDLWLEKTAYFSERDLPEFFRTEQLEQLLTMCEVEICKETKAIMHLKPTYLRFSPSAASPFPMLNGPEETRLRMRYSGVLEHTLDEVRYNWSVLRKFNDCLSKAVPFVNWSMCVNVVPEGCVPMTVSSFLSAARKLCLGYVKNKLQQAVFSKTAVVREAPPKMVFERLNFDHNEGKQASTDKETSMFYKAYEQIKSIDLTLLRPEKPVGSSPFLAFEVIFKGEYVVGEGGPYRQFFADVSAELQPSPSSPGFTEITNSCLKLLCPTPNTVNKQGDAKDKFTLTPSARSTKDLLLYEFLGLLMGCCMRTGVRLSLDLASIIWKQIVREPLSLGDLEEVDTSVVGMLRYITGEQLAAEEFDSIFTETFTAMLSDTSSVELLPDGANVPVTFDRREEYAELLLKARLSESAVQCKAIRKGISLIVPEAMLSFLTHEEIASLICGKPTVDLQMLRRHTRYSKGLAEDSDQVKFFWEVLEELSETDKLRFIKFCWGQERLPANDEEYEDRQVRFMIKASTRNDDGKEDALPKADTCFFNLELPKYSTKEKMKEKLLLAIYTDFISMNAEDNPALDPRFVSNSVPYEE